MPRARDERYDEEEDDDGRESATRVRARRAAPPPAAYKVFARLRMAVWLGAGASLSFFGLLFLDGQKHAANVSVYATCMILVYTLARAAEGFLDNLERAAEKRPGA